MQKQTDLLIIRAGPVRLATAACARPLGREHLHVGKQMTF
jgi:hypothetical protein